MLTRIIYGVILLPIVVLIVNMGGEFLRFSLLLLSLLALNETYRALFINGLLRIFGYIFLVVYYLFLDIFLENFFALTLIWILLNLIYMVIRYGYVNQMLCFANITAPIYTGVLLSTVYLSRDHNIYLVWLIFIGAWGSDTFAYFIGKLIGKTKLTPKLSPSKTVEGAIGGIVGASILGIIYTFVLSNIFDNYSINLLWRYGITSAIIAVFAQIGDLIASSIKRQSGIKDFGSLIPGHGGAMDRFDSILVAGPVFYIILIYFL